MDFHGGVPARPYICIIDTASVSVVSVCGSLAAANIMHDAAYVAVLPREAPAKNGPKKNLNPDPKSHSSEASGPGKATSWTRAITWLLEKNLKKISPKWVKSLAPTIKIWGTLPAGSQEFIESCEIKTGRTHQKKSQDKEITHFRPEKATFPDHPLQELSGACSRALQVHAVAEQKLEDLRVSLAGQAEFGWSAGRRCVHREVSGPGAVETLDSTYLDDPPNVPLRMFTKW
ncbi:hypothetical protein K438DRAFT_1779775 [Mycena galopus ATCC 62051]|nr:hypothetical protein K438DRAFT_1779775 [Mycena galopus ATCC 62051]